MNFENRVEFVLFFDVLHGNPNGDPDAGNAPRVDPETGYGIVTDVCLKRKIRNFVGLTKGYQPPNDIYVKERGILAREQKRAYEAIKAEPSDRPNDDARAWMCASYFDVRTFGAVMTTGRAEKEEPTDASAGKGKASKKELKRWNCGQVRGPVQLGFAKSEAPIFSMEHAITRVALTNADDTGRSASEDEGEERAATGQMGRKHTVPYALYRAHGFISPFLAKDTGFGAADYTLLLEALTHMFEHDRSASRGEMAARALGVFEHESALGNAPAHRLFESIRVGGPNGDGKPPRSFADYKIVNPARLPAGVNFRWVVDPNGYV